MGLSQVGQTIDSCLLIIPLKFIILRYYVHVDESTICYDELGCINNFYFADPLLWPIDLLPESRTKINTYFTLYTRDMLPNIPPVTIICSLISKAISQLILL